MLMGCFYRHLSVYIVYTIVVCIQQMVYAVCDRGIII